MYGFVDTTGPQPEDKLPAEALKLNGKYIEKLDDEKPDDEKSDDEKSVVGYRTLYVSGRELLESEIDDYQVGNSDGTRYRGKRYPPRIITVTYQLVAKDAQAFRASYNKLNRILDVENAILSFHDEEDKYFIGTKSGNSVVTPGMNRVIGEIEFYCADPFKYSTAEKEFKATLSEDKKSMELTIKNDGTKEVPVSYTITHGSENGFVGIVSEHGVIELGDITERKEEEKQRSEYPINYKDGSDYSQMNGDVDNAVFFDKNYGKTGKTIPHKEAVDDKTTWLGIGENKPGLEWHGMAKTKEFPSETNTANTVVFGKVWFEPDPNDATQLGIIEYCMAADDGTHLMSVRIAKWEPNRRSAYLIFCVGGEEVERVEYDPYDSQMTKKDSGCFYMAKYGEKFEFNFGGLYRYYEENLKEKKAGRVSVFIGQRDSYPMVKNMYLNYLTVRQDKVTYWVDVLNRYRDGAVIRIDGENTKVYLDGRENAGEVVKGSTFFKVPRGETKVRFFFSDFCQLTDGNNQPVMDVSAKIREAYL